MQIIPLQGSSERISPDKINTLQWVPGVWYVQLLVKLLIITLNKHLDIISKTFIEDGITFPCINNKEYIIDGIVRAVIYLDDTMKFLMISLIKSSSN